MVKDGLLLMRSTSVQTIWLKLCFYNGKASYVVVSSSVSNSPDSDSYELVKGFSPSSFLKSGALGET